MCENSVLFIIKRDKARQFKFCAAQSEVGLYLQQKYNINAIDNETVILISNGMVFERSAAILEIINYFGGLWGLLKVLKLLPVSFRDWFYKKLAENRYYIFGKKTECLIPTDDIRDRFL